MGLRDAPTALRGALGFLSRLPVGRDEQSWAAFRTAPWTLPVAGFLLGALVAVPVGATLALPIPSVTVALVYVVAVVALTGINHFDGVADLGDAVVVHGDAERRREVMGDTVLGVGGTLALVIVVAGLALGAVGLATLPLGAAVGLVVASEVGAKTAMATLIALGSPAHGGFGAAVAEETGPRGIIVPLALAALATVVTVPSLAAVSALAGAVVVALVLLWWARGRLDGVTGDVIGASNELVRVVALHVGLVVWHVGVEFWVDVSVGLALWEAIRWTPW